MRLLVVSNYYPPCFFGGYELGCRDVVGQLRGRGHEVSVLTSDHRKMEAGAETGVRRVLPLQSDGRRIRWHLRSAFLLLRAIFAAQPEVVYFWNQSGLSLWLAPLAQFFGFRCAFFLSDTSFVSWKVAVFFGRKGRWIIRGARRHFASKFLQELAVPHDYGMVIHWGIDPVAFPAAARERAKNGPLRLLYLGQIIPEKGVHTAIEAVASIVARAGPESVRLTIGGGSSKPEYLRELQRSVRERGLEQLIEFTGARDRAELPGIYRVHDVLLMPSIWNEPFAITPLEAMASGLAVIATNTGGSPEIFRDRVNALVFASGDTEACAAAIMELRADDTLYEKIRETGRGTVLENFSLEGMVDQIESDLKQMLR